MLARSASYSTPLTQIQTNTNHTTVILYTHSNYVVLATGFDRPSSNMKTGQMIQVWILGTEQHPAVAAYSGEDRVICGECPLRLDPETGKRACYVDVSRAPAQIWKTYKAGGYRSWDGHSLRMFQHRTIRWGAYGDPVLIPYPIVQKISAASAGWTGYTHQWKKPVFAAYKSHFMASADSEADKIEANSMGWRTFRVGDHAMDATEILCPNVSRGTQCNACRLCGGLGKKGARNIYIPAHGVSAKAHPSRRGVVLA